MTDPAPSASLADLEPESGSGSDSTADGAEEQAAAESAATEDAPAREYPKPEEESTVDEDGYEWFILKVTSNREKTVKMSLEKRIRREGLEDDFGEIVIPTQKVVDPKGGKKRVIEQKLFPGYMMIQMKLNEDSWYLVRDTTGVG
ncbi:MAG: transcription termination/antitermination NusG family protein, partial [Planctomycetota bacterium]